MQNHPVCWTVFAFSKHLTLFGILLFSTNLFPLVSFLSLFGALFLFDLARLRVISKSHKSRLSLLSSPPRFSTRICSRANLFSCFINNFPASLLPLGAFFTLTTWQFDFPYLWTWCYLATQAQFQNLKEVALSENRWQNLQN